MVTNEHCGVPGVPGAWCLTHEVTTPLPVTSNVLTNTVKNRKCSATRRPRERSRSTPLTGGIPGHTSGRVLDCVSAVRDAHDAIQRNRGLGIDRAKPGISRQTCHTANRKLNTSMRNRGPRIRKEIDGDMKHFNCMLRSIGVAHFTSLCNTPIVFYF